MADNRQQITLSGGTPIKMSGYEAFIKRYVELGPPQIDADKLIREFRSHEADATRYLLTDVATKNRYEELLMSKSKRTKKLKAQETDDQGAAGGGDSRNGAWC